MEKLSTEMNDIVPSFVILKSKSIRVNRVGQADVKPQVFQDKLLEIQHLALLII